LTFNQSGRKPAKASVDKGFTQCHNGSMQKRSSKNRDANVITAGIVEEATAESEQEKQNVKNPAAVALGRLGGLKGGKARAEKMTPEQRSEIARIAASARWRKKD